MPTYQADIVIVGAGAAGLMAAIWAGRRAGELSLRPEICVLEGSPKLGRKILISGGGRCNVTNRSVTPNDYAGSPRNSIKKILKRFDAVQTAAFFRDLRVEFKLESETGKLFPKTDRASTVLDSLLTEAKEYASIRFPHRVEQICWQDDTGDFEVVGDAGSVRCRQVVLATGGKSIPKTGSDGHGFTIAKELGHRITPLVIPALVPLTLPKEHFICGLSGITVRAALELWSPSGKRLERFENSTLCTHFGLSGPGPLDVSRYYLAAQDQDSNHRLTLNWIPSLTEDELCEVLRAESRRRPAALLREYLPERVTKALLVLWSEEPGVGQDGEKTVCQQLSKKAIRALSRIVTKTPLPLTGSRGFNFAEATAGGVPLSELQLKRMESRVRKGLFLCGEICDVDGRIGGFNFQWAWSSGYVAGVSAAESLVVND